MAAKKKAPEKNAPAPPPQLDQNSPAKGQNPFVTIYRDGKDFVEAAKISMLGCLVRCPQGICFVPGANIQEGPAGSNRLA